jgi:hypothetical protein
MVAADWDQGPAGEKSGEGVVAGWVQGRAAGAIPEAVASMGAETDWGRAAVEVPEAATAGAVADSDRVQMGERQEEGEEAGLEQGRSEEGGPEMEASTVVGTGPGRAGAGLPEAAPVGAMAVAGLDRGRKVQELKEGVGGD